MAVPASAQNMDQPASGYLDARLQTGLDAGHARIGETFQAQAVSEWQMNDCIVSPGARIYGKVVSASRHTKSSPESTLGLLIEGAECEDHRRAPLALHILEITFPSDASVPMHSVLPLGSGGLAAGSAVIAHDDNTAANQESSVHAGIVSGEIPMRLEIAGGPQFSDLLRSDKRTISLLTGTHLVLGTSEMIPADQQTHFHPTEKQP